MSDQLREAVSDLLLSLEPDHTPEDPDDKCPICIAAEKVRIALAAPATPGAEFASAIEAAARLMTQIGDDWRQAGDERKHAATEYLVTAIRALAPNPPGKFADLSNTDLLKLAGLLSEGGFETMYREVEAEARVRKEGQAAPPRGTR